MTVSSTNKSVVCPILIGRSSNLAALQALIEQAKSGQVALLCGEAGVGKSRLVAETKTYAAAKGFLLLQGNCFPTDLSCPYAPLLDLLRSLFASRSAAEIATEVSPFARELFQLLPDVVPLTSQPPLPTLDREQEKRRLFASLAQFFIHQAAKQPVLLVVEDLHWSDDTSLEFLHYLARRCVAQPFVLLLTYRNDEVHPSLRRWLAQVDREHLAQEFVLSRLTRQDVDAMLRAIFDLRRPARLELPEPIYTLTEGNPFFIEEVLKTLLTVGEIYYVDGSWQLKSHKGNPASRPHIPRSVQDAVQQRTDQLSEGARQVLVLAAVAGRRFDFALLQRLTQHDEQQLLVLMKELIAAQLVVEESAEQFAFRHALTRQAVYAELLVRERKVLHRRIAETMEVLYAPAIDGHLADLAYHFYEAGAWEHVLDYAPRAGEKAQALYAPQAAVEHFTHALDATYHLSAIPTLFHARGQAYESLDDFEHARADYEAALQIARGTDNHQAEWEALLSLGMLWTGRDYERSGAYYAHAFELARTMDAPAIVARSLNRVGNWHLNLERPLEALQHHREALTIFQELHDPHGLAETLDLLGMASYLAGDLVQGTTYYEQAVTLFRQLDDRQGLASSLATLTLRGPTSQTNTIVSAVASLAEVIPDGQMALKTAREIGQRSAESYALCLLGFCSGAQGEYARALECAQGSLEIAEEIEHRQWMTAAHCSLGVLYLDLLALPEAQRHLEQALALANGMYSLHWMHSVTGNLASTYILQHELVQAETILHAALTPETPAQTLGQRLSWHACAELALACGNPVLALQIVDRLITSAANLSSERSIPRLSKLRGEALTMLNQVTEAEATLLSAQEVALRQGARPLLWRISVVLGRLYQAQERPEEAELAFATARMRIEELAANVPDERLREHFLQAATALMPPSRIHELSPRQAAKKAPGGLTAREREVAILIAQGKSNQAIADGLVVTKRTIETHIGNIMFKLGCTSRTQIAVWAVETGLVSKTETESST